MSDVKAIAFFLPQFHPIPENDLWWGKGFTEWVGVTRARPLYPGHHQPRLPADLGFYDLRVAEVREEQAALAARYGIHGLCWYYYWFDGRRLLEGPLDAMLRSGRPALPFCICWANESWSRRWDGTENELLVAQRHGPGSDRRFIEDVLPVLRDPRYIRVGGAPLLLVYRPQLLPDPARTTALWREVARAEGLGELHLALVQGSDRDPRPLGFDSGVEFPPLVDLPPQLDSHALGLDPRFSGRVWDYAAVASRTVATPAPAYPRFRGVMTAWDNTPRRGLRAHLFHGATPERYERWLRDAVELTRAERRPGERFVFVNAWNEWGEGAYLEPDQRLGHAWLAATARGLGRTVPRIEGPRLSQPPEEDPAFQPGPPSALAGATEGGLLHLARGNCADPLSTMELAPGGPVSLSGWAVTPPVEPAREGAMAWLVLRSRALAATFHARVRRTESDHVAAFLHRDERRFTERAGFDATLSLEAVPAGRYRLGLLASSGDDAAVAWATHDVRVLGSRGSLSERRGRAIPVAGAVLRGEGLVCALDAELATPLAIGAGQVLRLSGICWHPRLEVRAIDLLLDGERHAVEHLRLGRPDVLCRTELEDDPDGRAAESGFVGFVAVGRLATARDASLVLRARLANGEVHEAPLGVARLLPGLEASPGPRPPAGSSAAPSVVVCIVTCDPDPRLLAEQLAAVRSQTHGRWTCLVVDDASTDARFTALLRLVGDDPRFSIERNPRRVGLRAAAERCLARVPTGADFVALLDPDEVWSANRLERCLAAFRPGIELVRCGADAAEDSVLLLDAAAPRDHGLTALGACLLFDAGDAAMFHATLLERFLPFPPPEAAPRHEHWIVCAALASGGIGRTAGTVARRERGAPGPDSSTRGRIAAPLVGAVPRPADLRRRLRSYVDRCAQEFDGDVLRIAQLARVLRLRFPDLTPAQKRDIDRAARFDRSPLELARAALDRPRNDPGSRPELRLVRALLSARVLDLYHRLSRRRIRRRHAAATARAVAGLPLPVGSGGDSAVASARVEAR